MALDRDKSEVSEEDCGTRERKKGGIPLRCLEWISLEKLQPSQSNGSHEAGERETSYLRVLKNSKLGVLQVHRADPRFPIGRTRLETVGVVSCAVIMTLATIEV